MKNNNPVTYPGFSYEAGELSKFLAASGLFSIMLKTGEIIHYMPDDKNLFYQWLVSHNIEKI